MARASKLSGLSVRELQRELAARQRGVQRLVKKHARLIAKAQELAAQISELGGSVSSGGLMGVRRRPKNEMNLVNALAKVLDGKTMSVTEVTDSVQKAGYNTTSANFRTIVNQTLINSGKFKRVDRGQYTAK